jgi:hypothetical protein
MHHETRFHHAWNTSDILSSHESPPAAIVGGNSVTGEGKMTDDAVLPQEPLWLAIERKLADLGAPDLDEGNRESTVHRIAEALDGAGYNVSRHAGNLLALRAAVDARIAVGRPMLTDFTAATGALGLEDVTDVQQATVGIVREVGEAWPKLKDLDRRADILRIVEKKRLDLMVEKANGLPDDQGIRYLIGEQVAPETIIEAMGITEEKLAEVNAAIEAERAEIHRVQELLGAVEDKTAEDKARHLITNDVADELIVEVAGIDRAVIDAAKEAMVEELEEKQRLAEEEAARKKAAAEGPALDDIPADEMLEHIEAIREIMEFSDQEDEIRQMCEQSNLPKALVDIAVSDPDKLDELESAAGG